MKDKQYFNKIEPFFYQKKIKFEKEYKFHPTRKWRFDLALIDHKIAFEIQGGLYIQGGHNRGRALLKEYEKINMATILGWRVFLYGLSKQPNHPSLEAFIFYVLGTLKIIQ